jgi:hypothetical protein
LEANNAKEEEEEWAWERKTINEPMRRSKDKGMEWMCTRSEAEVEGS